MREVSEQVRRLLTIKHYLDGLEKGEIIGSRCKKCGALSIPLKPVCARCGSFDLEEIQSKGEGVLRSFTVIYAALPHLVDRAPYVIGLVRLDEGPSIMGRLVGLDATKPGKIKIGTRIKFEILKENGKAVVAFRPDLGK